MSEPHKIVPFEFKEIACPLKRGTGQRFFIDLQQASVKDMHELHADRAIYVADNSGDTPGKTDDGPLVLMKNIPLKVSLSRHQDICCLSADAKVRSLRDGGIYTVGFSDEEIFWLIDALRMQWKWVDERSSHLLAGMMRRVDQRVQ